MIIKKIKFKNFMAYYGEVDFDIDTTEERNVTVVFAPNDTGKSCFFKGIVYCLYGLDRGEKVKDIINVNAFEESDYHTYVTVVAEHEGNLLEITRCVERRSTGRIKPNERDFIDVATVFINGEDLKTNSDQNSYRYDYEEFISSILHKDASRYFFFDGEKIEAYNIASEEEYKEAIVRILGIKEVQYGVEDLRKIVKEYEKERDEKLSTQSEANLIITEKNGVDSRLDGLRVEILDFEKGLSDKKTRRNGLEEELKQYEEARSKIERKQELRDRVIKGLEAEIAKTEEKRKAVFKEFSTVIAGCYLAKQIKNSPEYDHQALNHVSFDQSIETFLISVAEQPECVCGHPINESSKNAILAFVEKQKNVDEATLIKRERYRAFSEIEKYQVKSAQEGQKYLNFTSELFKNRMQLNAAQKELNDLKMETQPFAEEKYDRISQAYALEEKGILEQNNKIERHKGKIEELEGQLREIENKLKQFKTVNKEIADAEGKYEIAQKASAMFADYLDELTFMKKAEVEQHASEIFLNLTNKARKYKGLVITDDYNLELELNDGGRYRIQEGGILNPSTGQSKIISLSYIAAINKASNSVAPVVIDNPVGLFSEEHRRSVTSYMRHFGKQVIFMVTEADLSDEYKEIVDPYVNAYYYLADESDKTWNKTVIKEKVIPYAF